ncbi:hypothetical protein M6B38_271705 [Iris pallida]|uniref:Uncharacterized protein n=1 Tax=Iris pallida TaxID=29817 RepID=A0AAX6HSG0_IRIPA|nr:hypothetical protein M6B38_300815 [Iris pallida]KAJ6849023.1 hypothetical protein M6B38_271705 [Iris pallida]
MLLLSSVDLILVLEFCF